MPPTTLPQILRGRNQAEIARQLGESRALVNTWAHGKSVPQVRHLPKLAQVLKVSVADLASMIADAASDGPDSVAV